MFGNPLFAATGLRTLVLSSTESNVNLYERFGSPSDPQRVIVILKSSAVITTLHTGDWPAGSELSLYNFGYILGVGGAGGLGGGIGTAQQGQTDGFPGEPALELGVTTKIYMDAGQGYIWGGGGGGGGGSYTTVVQAIVGGGGGGGGVSGGLGGLGGASTGGGRSPSGGDATSGISAVPGAGGSSVSIPDGGNGGSWGASGNPGAGTINPGAGGNGGFSIFSNGFTFTFPRTSSIELYSRGQILGANT